MNDLLVCANCNVCVGGGSLCGNLWYFVVQYAVYCVLYTAVLRFHPHPTPTPPDRVEFSTRVHVSSCLCQDIMCVRDVCRSKKFYRNNPPNWSTTHRDQMHVTRTATVLGALISASGTAPCTLLLNVRRHTAMSYASTATGAVRAISMFPATPSPLPPPPPPPPPPLPPPMPPPPLWPSAPLPPRRCACGDGGSDAARDEARPSLTSDRE